jgi:hypothetical protein
MDRKIEEARQEVNEILNWIISEAQGQEIHEAERGVFRRLLRLGRILRELFVLTAGTGWMGKELLDNDGVEFRHLLDSERRYFSIFGEITIVRAH